MIININIYKYKINCLDFRDVNLGELKTKTMLMDGADGRDYYCNQYHINALNSIFDIFTDIHGFSWDNITGCINYKSLLQVPDKYEQDHVVSVMFIEQKPSINSIIPSGWQSNYYHYIN